MSKLSEGLEFIISGPISDVLKPLMVRQQAERTDIGINMAHEVMLFVMANVPGVEAIRWWQYTPYFNDGDECTFSIRQVQLKLTESLRNEHQLQDFLDENVIVDGLPPYWLNGRTNPAYETEYKRRIAPLKQYENCISDLYKILGQPHIRGALSAAFGDGVQVTVDRDGVNIETIQHE